MILVGSGRRHGTGFGISHSVLKRTSGFLEAHVSISYYINLHFFAS